MTRVGAFGLASLLWACPVCEILGLTLIPLATAWSIGRAGFRLPGRVGRRLPFGSRSRI